MAQEWITPEGIILEQFEEESVDGTTITYTKTDESGHYTEKPIILSSTLPSTINVTIEEDMGIIRLSGNLPSIIEETTYYITLRLIERDSLDTIVRKDDRYFAIKSKCYVVAWNDSKSNILPTQYANTTFSIDLIGDGYINHTNGNEIFKKIDGELPTGISVNNMGIISGYLDSDSSSKEQYEFTINVTVNGIDIVEPRLFILPITGSSSSSAPFWITNEGIIGNANYNEESSFLISALDFSGSSNLVYQLAGSDDEHTTEDITGLPPGLQLTNLPDGSAAKISGVLSTTQVRDWAFGAYALKYEDGGFIRSPYRKFIITTNQVSEEHEIDWGDEDIINIGNFTVGDNVSGKLPSAKTKDGSKITYSYAGDGYPKGLILSPDGTISGNIEYQDTGDYSFFVMAKSDYTYITKTIKLTLKKGLGRNALKTFLRINLEYKNDYTNLKDKFNPNTKYKSNITTYSVDNFPIIDVATLACYDREVLASMMNFGEMGQPEVVRFGETRSLAYSQVDSRGDIAANYEVIYKPVDESTYQWDPINCGNYPFEEKLQQLKDTHLIDEDAKLDFNNEEYDSYTKTDDIIDEVNTYTDLLHYNTDDLIRGDKIRVLRDELNGNNTQYYEFDERLNGWKLLGSDLPMKEVKTDPRVRFSVFNFKNVRKILSQKVYVYQKEGTYLYDFGNQQIVTDYEQGKTLTITNPWCFDIEKNKGNITLDKIPEGEEMVMPYITNEDVQDRTGISPYVQFLDESVEPLPMWKRKQAKEWQPKTKYNTNDVIIYKLTYYKCKQQFTSGETFEFDSNLLEQLNSDDINSILTKNYFPTLDIGYYEPGTNRAYLKNVNKEELKGAYWYRKDFLFWDLICEPLYNKETSTFGVPFYSNQNFFENMDRNTKLRTFQLKVNTQGATVFIDAGEYEVIRKGNVYTVKVTDGTIIHYRVSKDNYVTQEASYPLYNDENITIDLLKECVVTVTPTPSDATVTLLATGYEQVDNTITVPEGTLVRIIVSKEDYATTDITIVPNDFNVLRYIALKKMVTLSVRAVPSNATIELIAEGYQQVDNTITVPEQTYVTYIVSESSHTTKKGTIRIDMDTNYIISLEFNVYTFTIEPTPIDSIVEIFASDPKSEQFGNSMLVAGNTSITYRVSKDGYATVEETLNNGISSDDPYPIVLSKIVKFEIIPTPSDAIVTLKCDGYEQVEGTNYIYIPAGKAVAYKIERVGYKTVSGSEYIRENTVYEKTLVPNKYNITLAPTELNTKLTVWSSEKEYVKDKLGSVTIKDVSYGTKIYYRLVKDLFKTKESFVTVERTETIELSMEREIYTLTFEKTQSDTELQISAPGYIPVGNTITVPSETTVRYTLSGRHYLTIENDIYATKTETIPVTCPNTPIIVTVKSNYDDNIGPYDSYTSITLTCPQAESVTRNTEASITVPWGSTVHYVMTKNHYNRMYGGVMEGDIVVRPENDENIFVTPEMFKDMFTTTINPYPSDAKVTITSFGYTQVGNTITTPYGAIVRYKLEKAEYDTYQDELSLVEDDTIINARCLWNPTEKVFVESGVNGTYIFNILEKSVVEVNLLGAGGAGFGYCYKKPHYDDDYVIECTSGGSGTGWYGKITLPAGTYSVTIGKGAEDKNQAGSTMLDGILLVPGGLSKSTIGTGSPIWLSSDYEHKNDEIYIGIGGTFNQVEVGRKSGTVTTSTPGSYPTSPYAILTNSGASKTFQFSNYTPDTWFAGYDGCVSIKFLNAV